MIRARTRFVHVRTTVCTAILLVLAAATASSAQTELSGDPIGIARAAGRITIDGDLGDEGWRGSVPITTWYETNPGDNTEPKVRNVGYLAYDERFFYAAFEFDDPEPLAIRAPYSDHDGIDGNYTDYGGVILDTRNDGHSGVLLLATPRGIQYDAITDDSSGEDSSPDFFWDAAATITDTGWTLEIRVPFSSLRYRNLDPQTWGILLYRNYPRDFRYQIFSAKLPRGGNCFVCRANTLRGLAGLPSGGHVVLAPYVSTAREARPIGDLGSRLDATDTRSRVGFDLKWTPTADQAVDLTVKPDFSQIESDTAQIATNERFALFFAEKRPFFLEGLELLSTPVQAVYTRTITEPAWGSRLTGKTHGFSYTALFAEDEGGGSVVVPGVDASNLVDQDFGSSVLIARAKRDIQHSFVGMLATVRDAHDDNGHNVVVGPDFRFQSSTESIDGQLLFSDTRTPLRPDLDPSWTGQTLRSHGAELGWNHSTTHLELGARYKDLGEGFRADTGFVPQVGYREISGDGGWTVRPNGPIRRVRTFVDVERQTDMDGDLISRNVAPGVAMDAKWNGFLRFRYYDDRIRTGGRLIDRRRVGYEVGFSPSRAVSRVAVDGNVGEEIDFDNSRPGEGSTVNISATLNPTNHLELALVQNQRWLDVPVAAGGDARLFTARVSRLRGTYTFTAKSFARVIGQYVSTTRDPSLYVDPAARRSAGFTASALFAYKINWQSVLFVGYGDARELSARETLEASARQIFVKVSYAFQK